jgi:hypothetical protein
VCTVLLRLEPGGPWPLLLAAVRDEFVDRDWDPPARHWPASAPGLVGGRDRTAHGTWLAVRPFLDPGPGAGVAALLNGVRLDPPPYGARPTRGGLPLTALVDERELSRADLAELPSAAGVRSPAYDGFHLLRGTATGAVVWTWDGEALSSQELPAGDHIITNAGVGLDEDPLVPHFAPLFAATPSPSPTPGADPASAWGPWISLLRGDGLAGDDPRALIVRRSFGDRVYGSTSASLVAIGPTAARYDFTANPASPDWREVALSD